MGSPITMKPMTYLVSFTLFVILFMCLGGYVGYGRMADHFLPQAYLDAAPVNVLVLSDRQGPLLHWEATVPLPDGAYARILASNRPEPISISYSGQATPSVGGIPLAANERTEDLRIDPAGRYLFARVFASSGLKNEETTWLCKYDLRSRRLVRRSSVNPRLLPALFRP